MSKLSCELLSRYTWIGYVQGYDVPFVSSLMTSSNGNIFRVTGPLWGESTGRLRKMSLIPSALSKPYLYLIAYRLIAGIVKILRNDAMEPEEITNIEIYRLKFILKRHVFVLHVTSVSTGSVQVTHRAVGARTMHGFGTDLVRNPAIWLVESRVYVNLFAYRGRMHIILPNFWLLWGGIAAQRACNAECKYNSPGPLFTKKTPSYGYRDPHDKPKTVWLPSQVYTGNPYTDKTASS